MNIDSSIINDYLNGNENYIHHWLYYNITDEGTYTFDKPNPHYKDSVRRIFEETCNCLNNFVPFNLDIFNELFPEWQKLTKNVNIILSVGCPKPYDAMTREHDGVEYMIFDLVRFYDYEKSGEDIISIIKAMITHEFTHICIHAKYPYEFDTYIDKLQYIVFNEGFAHLLAFKDDIKAYDFSKMIDTHYNKSLQKLKEALLETNEQKQKQYLEEADCGAYWDKFASISGKLFLSSNINNLKDIFLDGPSKIVNRMIEN